MIQTKKDIELKRMEQYILNAHNLDEFNPNNFECEDWAYVGTKGNKMLLKLILFDKENKNITPVRLTQEMLKNSGFKDDKYKANSLGYYNEATNSVIRINYENDENFSEVKINKDNYIIGDIKYLHQLQHIFRKNNINIDIIP